MKKIILLSIIINFLFSYIGIVSAINGEAYVKRNKLIPLHLGDKIDKNDYIITKNGILQIIFNDKTTITIGKNSKLSIKNYLFNPQNKRKNRIKLFTTKGLFKIITGKIGKLNPNKFKIKTANSTIGIRGTIIALNANPKFDKVGCLGGEVIVFSNFNKNYVIIKPGYMTIVLPKKPPLPPKPIKKIVIPKAKPVNKKLSQNTLSTPIGETVTQNNNADKLNNTKVEYVYKSSSLSYGFYLNKDNIPTDVWLEGSTAPTILLDAYFKTNIKATYEGKAIAVLNNEKLIGDITSTIDFGKKTINGNLNLNEGKWNFSFASSINQNGFSTTLMPTSASEISGSGTIDGKFYNKGEKIGGHFNISTNEGTAKGVYGAITSIENLK